MAVGNTSLMLLHRRSVLAGLALIPTTCNARTNDLPVGRGPTISPEDLGWTPDTSPVDTATLINRALQIARDDGITYYDNAPRWVAGTIHVGGQVLMDFGAKHSWRAVYDNPNRFAEVQGYRNGGYASSGKRVFVDTAGARGSIIRGPMTLICGWPQNMTLAERAKIPADLVAITAATPKSSAEIAFETLSIVGFGHALFQARQSGAPEMILPYTRWTIDITTIRCCLEPIVTGAGSNGLDDAVFEVLRMSRNGGRSILRATELNAISLFCFGLNRNDDLEPGEVTLKKGRQTARVRHEALAPGMVVAALGGRLNNDGNAIPFVSQIADVGKETVTFVDAPEANFTGGYVVNPPSLLLANSGLNTMHAYFEGIHDEAVALTRGSKIVSQDFKISRGHFASRSGNAIAVGSDGGAVEIQLNPRSIGNKWVKKLVGQRADGD